MTAADALAERDRVLAEVQLAHRRKIDAGLDVLRRWADRGRPFSANQCREELRAVGIDGPKLPGAVFTAAITAKIIRRVGWETSTGKRTNGKPVARYIAAGQRTPLEVLTVPAHRDPTGRFTTPDQDEAAPALFEIGATR